MPENEPDSGFQLFRGILRNAQRRVVGRGLIHFGVAVRMTETIEIQSPDIKASLAQRITPGPAVESMRDRKCRRECRARESSCAAAEKSVIHAPVVTCMVIWLRKNIRGVAWPSHVPLTSVPAI